MHKTVNKKTLRELDLSVYINKNGQLKIGRKKGVSAKRIKKDPAFLRLRQYAVEFGRASRMSGRIRHTFGHLGAAIGGSHLPARLMQVLLQVLRSDTRHGVGNRCVADGDLHYLEGFEFNETFQPPALSDLRCSLLRSAKGDQVLVKTDAFSPSVFLSGQKIPATHCQLSLLVAAIPEGNGPARLFSTGAGSILVEQPLIPSLQVMVDIDASETPYVYCVALSVAFFRFAGQLSAPCANGRHDQLRILRVFSA